MKGFNLQRTMRIKKDKEGKLSIYTIKTKLVIPLRRLEKMEILTPSMVNYLKDYESRLQKDLEGKIVDTKTLTRIRTILSKPKLDKDPILDKDMKPSSVRYTESHYRRLGFKGYDDWKKIDDERRAKAERLRKEAEQKKNMEKSNAKAE